MSEDLLLQLRTAAPRGVELEDLEAQGAALEQLRRIFLHQVRGLVEELKGSASAFDSAWRSIVLNVAGGRTAEMQAARGPLLATIEERLDQLARSRALVGRVRLSHGEAAVPDPDVLLLESAALARMKTNIFDRWQTPEDLERLAVEHYPLSQKQLERIAAACPPPAEWYAGEEESHVGWLS